MENLLVWSWILEYILETSSPSFCKNFNSGLYFTKKLAYWTKSAIMTSLWRHIRDVCIFFFLGMFGKRRPIASLWFQIGTHQAFIFQVNRGIATILKWSCFMNKSFWYSVFMVIMKSYLSSSFISSRHLYFLWTTGLPVPFGCVAIFEDTTTPTPGLTCCKNSK